MNKFYPKWQALQVNGGTVIQATLRTRAAEHKLQMLVQPGQAVAGCIQQMTSDLHRAWDIDYPPLSKLYADALRDGDHARCIQIEERNGLYGLPPEIVSIGLAAIERGEDPAGVISKAMEGDQ